MKTSLKLNTMAIVVTCAGVVSGCANTMGPSDPYYPPATQSYPSSQNYPSPQYPNNQYPTTQYPNTQRTQANVLGIVESIDFYRADSQGSGAGAIVGGLIGAAVGSQVGNGDGRTAATVAGAVGGALVGNSVEKNRNGTTADKAQIRVRLDTGERLTLVQDSANGIRVGERVRIVDNRVYRY